MSSSYFSPVVKAAASSNGHLAHHRVQSCFPTAVYRGSTHTSPGRSSRGIGLELVRQLLVSPLNFVVATCRTPETATALHALKHSAKGELHVLKLDTSDKASMDNLIGPLGKVLGTQGLDYLINNAAIVRTCPFSYEAPS